MLRFYGGGNISVEGKNGGFSLIVTVSEDGSSTLGSAKKPLSLKDAQAELKRLCKLSTAKYNYFFVLGFLSLAFIDFFQS